MKPITRVEMYLSAAANSEEIDMEPRTREEYYLKQIADNIASGGGGGGSGLPEVTAADNGKVLGVVNGAWAATKTTPLIVTLTPTNPTDPLGGGTHNASAADLSAAWAAGRAIRASISGVADFDLAMYDATGETYSCNFLYYAGSTWFIVNAVVTENGTYGCMLFPITAVST
jgi:hypothetical protein